MSTHYQSLEALVTASILNVQTADTRKMLAKQIVLVGGSTKIDGIVDEMEERLIEVLPRYVQEVDMVDVLDAKHDDRADLSWIGMAIVSPSDGSRHCWMTAKEWDMYGPRSLRSKVPFEW